MKNSESYIIIDSSKNIKISDDLRNAQLLQDLSGLVNMDQDDELGKEINKFFIYLLPQNKEGNVLNANYALSKKILNDLKLTKQSEENKFKDYLTEIMNKDVKLCFSLTRDITEKLSFILAIIYKNVKKSKKFNKFEELTEFIKKTSLKENKSILEDYNKNNIKNEMDLFIEKKNKTSENIINHSFATPNVKMLNDFDKKGNLYIYTETKKYNNYLNLQEIFILREKFSFVKKLKFTLKRNKDNNDTFEEKDTINNIFLLFNLEWLFPIAFEIKIDLSNDDILNYIISSNKNRYNFLLKKSKSFKKMTNYSRESQKKVLDGNETSNFETVTDFEIISKDSEDESLSMISSNKGSRYEDPKIQENFIKTYISSLEMLIIYWYFLGNINGIKVFKFNIPINLEDKIVSMLKERNITLFELNLLSNIKTDEILEVTGYFNSLDDKLFQQILTFLMKTTNLKKCYMNFFPNEEYFKPEFLLNIYMNNERKIKENLFQGKNLSENLDIFLLKQMAKKFGTNLEKFFVFASNQLPEELYLIFDMPSLFNQIDCYEIIIIKFILNLLMSIDDVKGKKLHSLNIIASQLPFDNRKHPFLNNIFKNIQLYNNNDSPLKKLSLEFKIFEIPNFYRIIPSKITYLSIKYFDLITFEYFAEYITSVEFNCHTELRSLKIGLSNTILYMEQCFSLILKLLVECPKKLEEIYIYTSLYTNFDYVRTILEKTNYNKIEKIHMQFNKNSLVDEKLKKMNDSKTEKQKNEYFQNLYYVIKDEKSKQKILNVMYIIGNKYNKNFMDFNIYLAIERLLNSKDKKKVIIEYK